MKIQLWSLGKPHEPYVAAGVADFTKRLSHYYPASWHIIPLPKHTGMMSEMDIRKKEGELIISLLKKEDFLVLLDERGKEFKSEELAQWLMQRSNESHKTIIFLIGGAFGVSEDVKARANMTWSLSKLVFPHQLVRLILAEQLYRACTILRNEKYHHS